MREGRKDGKYLNVMINTPLYEELEAFSRETGITKTHAVEAGLRMYMDDIYARHGFVAGDNK